ncbi:SH3 domain-containing protein [Bacillus halotolerans]|uniref:SH3 domain-containing protein n=1 Tax=Bacillus halotolerans TaxID=260554 RepID=UPI00228075D0|nr:SH3 domain-containing protein [Bacillus halotolerans]MCY8473229.1 SH3 domain-containing protein [Bacillus halotolerans]MEC1647758.1 SH3 domain-containing protein [Bacillus halotolerans]
MSKKHFVLIVCIIVAGALFPPFSAVTAAQGEAVIATDEMNVRSGPGLSYGIMAEVKKGERYPILKEDGDWVQIQLGSGDKGWVVSWLITKEKQSGTSSTDSSETVTSTDPDLRMRTGPGTSYEVIGKFPQGSQASVIDKDSGWIKISYRNSTGWVSSEYVTSGSGSSASEENDQTESSGSTTGTVGVSSLNVRGSASHDAAIITKLSRGTKLTILEEKNGWLHIEVNGLKGWVASHYIVTSSDPAEDSADVSSSDSTKKAYIVYGGTNLRSDASTSASIVKRAAKGDAYSITGSKGSWYEVKLDNGQTAYVANWVVQTSKSAEESGEPPVADSASGSGSLKNKAIVVDPGHGGKDSGTIGYSGQFEKKLTIKTAKLLASKLRSAGADVYVTRQDDTFVSLQSRVSTSHYRNADAFISIHYDSFADTSTRGSTAYYYSPAKDQELASDVHSEVVKRSSIPDRGVLFGDYYVLRENKQPAMLYELGYVSHPQEEAIVHSNSYQEKVTDGIESGLEKYFQ